MFPHMCKGMTTPLPVHTTKREILFCFTFQAFSSIPWSFLELRGTPQTPEVRLHTGTCIQHLAGAGTCWTSRDKD